GARRRSGRGPCAGGLALRRLRLDPGQAGGRLRLPRQARAQLPGPLWRPVPRHRPMHTEQSMPSDNIFSGLKVVDMASFIAGPGAATILSDFGADVIKVEPPNGDTWRIGHKIPPQPQADDAYQWHLANRNKRGMTLDLKSPDAQKVLQELVTWAD